MQKYLQSATKCTFIVICFHIFKFLEQILLPDNHDLLFLKPYLRIFSNYLALFVSIFPPFYLRGRIQKSLFSGQDFQRFEDGACSLSKFIRPEGKFN